MGDEATEGKTAGLRRAAVGGTAARAFCCGLLGLLLLAGITALVLYLVYRPAKPRLTVVGAAVYELNATAPAGAAAVVSTRMQFTVAIRNPNQRSSVLYDRLAAYVAFREQPITPAAPLPPMYQEEDSTVAVSPLLGGALVAVAPEVAGGLQTEQAYGALGLRLVLMGRIKYKVGPLYSVWASMFARCDILVSLRSGAYGQVPLLGVADCSVSS
ncbi:unnamed protein product [Spirodela intermedia]|uniref:Uncharacterized protein n=1 Tax=Spirodela intermedia TaxID=51605 RepID=A0A7I8K361_SPIIN|nr:unnamed protein product [Spirodela intermedia]